MSRPEWKKRARDEPIYEGVRVADQEILDSLAVEVRSKMRLILDAMEWPQTIVFRYGDSDRVVCPFVLGLSFEGNPLLRGFQLEGMSRSGKGAGWRVFQVGKMDRLASHQEFFNPEEFQFDNVYPWIYKVMRTL